jgi:nucleotide-binding universal stress UspA family protein
MKTSLQSRQKRAAPARRAKAAARPDPAVAKLENILVPTDFSEVSRKAIKYAIPFARKFGARITLLHVIEPLPYVADLTYVPLGQGFPVDPAKKELDAIAKLMLPPNLLNKALIRVGPAFEVIANVARELSIDLSVIATHGHTGFTHVFMGSTAERVVRHAPCPVLVVRERERDFVSNHKPAPAATARA